MGQLLVSFLFAQILLVVPFTLPGSLCFFLQLFLRQNGWCHRNREASDEAKDDVDLHMPLTVYLLRSVDNHPVNEAVDDRCRQFLRIPVLP